MSLLSCHIARYDTTCLLRHNITIPYDRFSYAPPRQDWLLPSYIAACYYGRRAAINVISRIALSRHDTLNSLRHTPLILRHVIPVTVTLMAAITPATRRHIAIHVVYAERHYHICRFEYLAAYYIYYADMSLFCAAAITL